MDKKKIPTFYKVMYQDNIFAIGMMTQEDLEEKNKNKYMAAIVSLGTKNGEENPRFSTSIQSFEILHSADKVTQLTTLNEHLSLLKALQKNNMMYNRKTRKLTEIKKGGTRK